MSFMIWGLWTEISFRWKLEKSPQCNPNGFSMFQLFHHCLFSWRFLPWVLVLGPLHWAQQGQRRECFGKISDCGLAGFLRFSMVFRKYRINLITNNYHILSYIIKNQPKMFSLPVVFQLFFLNQKWFLLSEACGGGVMGGLVGLVPAVFTFGLSIPIGAMVVVFRKMEGINVRCS